jgi:hypothetical protein
MRHCFKCEHAARGVVNMPGGQQALAWLCKHPECSDPVEGDPLPCVMARQQVAFCGFTAKYYKEKDDARSGDVVKLVDKTPDAAQSVILPH